MEIRRVPSNWEHPRGQDGEYISLYGSRYDADCERWLQELRSWDTGVHPDRMTAEAQGVRYYWDWEGPPPDARVYFPKFDVPATAYQIYETVSEGRPISPVLQTEEQVIAWILQQGETRSFAEEFLRRGGVTSTFEITPEGHREIKLFYDV